MASAPNNGAVASKEEHRQQSYRENYIEPWAAEEAAHWDAALAGNSALREAFVKTLYEEVHGYLKISYAHAIMDIQSFYDT
eukprot:6555303-Pyramimonas_sp.AAC.1